MEKESSFVLEWKIENLSHWCAEVHGNSIASPSCPNIAHKYCDSMELYPRGISGKEEHLLVRFCGIKCAFSGDLSFVALDESSFWTRQVFAEEKNKFLLLPPGPNFEKMLAKIVKNEDQITVRCRIKSPKYHELRRIFTTISVLEISLKLDIKEILKEKPKGSICIAYIPYSRSVENEGLYLFTWFNEAAIQFIIEPRNEIKSAISVDICMSLLNCDDTIESREQKKYIFSDKTKWAFSDSMVIKDLVERRITILLGFKIKSKCMIKSYIGVLCDYNEVSIVTNDNIYFSDGKSLKNLEPVSRTQTEDSVTVLTEDFSCLFQDQDFSDLQLKSGGISFPVHRNILSARSPVFKRLLSSDMKGTASGEVDIGGIDPPTLARFLSFLYSGTVENLQWDSALKLYYAADKYEVLSLKRDCSDFLRANVSISNVCNILSFADRHQDEELSTVSKNFILDNYNAVLKSKEWDALTKSEPSLAANILTQFAVKDRVRKNDS